MTGLWIILGVVGVLIILLFAIANKIFNVAVGAKKTKEKVMKTNANQRRNHGESGKSQKELDNEWLAMQPLILRRHISRDGLQLTARILPANRSTDVWVLCIHGFAGKGLNLGMAARRWHEKGYHVLLPDLRGGGDSEGDYYGMGWLDRIDMIDWIQNVVLMEDKDAKVILHGISMGAAAVMMVTGEETLPSCVKAAIEDCGYTSVWEEFTIQLKKVFGLPQFPVMYLVNRMAKRRAGYTFKEASSVRQLKKSKTPTLFIHGDADAFVPFFMLDEVYSAAACEKEKMIFLGAQHGESAIVDPERYWEAVHRFTGHYLK